VLLKPDDSFAWRSACCLCAINTLAALDEYRNFRLLKCMYIPSGDMSDSSEDLTAHRRPSAVQFRLDLNLEHPPGPISTPKGGFKTRELLLRTPAQGILKCM
jgi:hypothetical protein